MLCGKCGTENNAEDSKFCKNCGSPLTAVASAAGDKASTEVFLDESDNAFLDIFHIPREETVFVKSCKLCIFRLIAKNQIAGYKSALSDSWLTDDEWLKNYDKEKKSESTKKFANALITILKVIAGIIIGIFKCLFSIIAAVVKVLLAIFSSVGSIILFFIIAVVAVFAADYFIDFGKISAYAVTAWNAVKGFVSRYYIAGLIIIGAALIIAAAITIKARKKEAKENRETEFARYQIQRSEGLEKKKEAQENIDTSMMLYNRLTDILEKLNKSRESVPDEFWDYGGELWYLYQSRRANTVQEAINLLERMKYQERMERLANEQVNLTKEIAYTADEIKRISAEARDFSEKAMLSAEEAADEAHSAAVAARSAEWEASNAKWAAWNA